jgi:hypothetical protein
MTIQIQDLSVSNDLSQSAMSAVRGGDVRTTGVDEVGLLTENRNPNNHPPTAQVGGVSAVQPVTVATLWNEMFGSIAPV